MSQVFLNRVWSVGHMLKKKSIWPADAEFKKKKIYLPDKIWAQVSLPIKQQYLIIKCYAA
jgi:hypothetical protein